MKNHPRIEAYGTIDELMAHTALLMDMLKDDADDRGFLLWILDRLMTASSILASEGDVSKKIPKISSNDTKYIEGRIDEMDSELEAMNHFILPGGHLTTSQCHVARTVCRRAERKIAGLVVEGFDVPEEVISFINRLSDYFFVLSRKIKKDLKISSKIWLPIVD